MNRIASGFSLILAGGLFILANFVFAETIVVDIKKYKFVPQDITVKVGTTVRWTNSEKRQYHSVWFKFLNEPTPEYFFPDETFERTFDKAGDYPYVCEPHEESHEMKGVVHVVP